MALIRLHCRAAYICYKTNICSKATLFCIVCLIIMVMGPFIITFAVGDFWYKNNIGREQPEIHYTGKLLVTLEGKNKSFNSENSEKNSSELLYVTWSTFPIYNQLIQQNLRNALVKSREHDLDRDGKADYVHITVDIPVNPWEEIYFVKLLLFFDYKMQELFKLHMEGLALIQYNSFTPGSDLYIIGDLKFFQRDAVMYGTHYDEYNKTTIDENSFDLDTYKMPNILQLNRAQNVHTRFCHTQEIWTSGSNSYFRIFVDVSIPNEIVVYIPTFLQQLRWAWVQYVSTFVVFFVIINIVKSFVFDNRVFSTIIEVPWKSHIM